jgi:hypothetical protein
VSRLDIPHWRDSQEVQDDEVTGGPYVGLIYTGAPQPCLLEGITAGIAAVAWVGSKAGAVAAITAANPPAGAIGWSIFGAVASGFALASGAETFLQCMGY